MELPAGDHGRMTMGIRRHRKHRVLKPSSDAPTIAFKFFEILEEAGLATGVVNFMTGSGR
jgi:hypothetical protein